MYEHRTGTLYRSSFVAVSAHLLGGSKSWVDHEVDVTISTKDHSPTFVTVSIVGSASEYMYHRRRSIISRQLLKDPARVAAFTAGLAYAPSPPWYTNGHDHHKILFDYYQELGSWHFGVEDTIPRKSWIAEKTFGLIKARHPFRNHLYLASAIPFDFIRYTTFHAWVLAASRAVGFGSCVGQCKARSLTVTACRRRCKPRKNGCRGFRRILLDSVYVGVAYSQDCALLEYGGEPIHVMMRSCNQSYSWA